MKNPNQHYSIIIIGGGHAGTEAALASARMGVDTLLLTHNIDTLGQMSCNPAIGGIGKGHLVKEIDAMGGVMAQAADHAGIQFRILNASKGPAVQATRAQTDRILYKAYVRKTLENQKNLSLFQQAVESLIIENNIVKGVITQMGLKFYADKVILTTGTFLGGIIHIGQQNYGAGRAGDAPANGLSKQLRGYDLGVGRLKTGTPPRLDGRTINFSRLDIQAGDGYEDKSQVPVFSFIGSSDDHPRQIPCHITHTNEKSHQIIQDNMHNSPMWSGNISSNAPRYCPSIEDKVVRFKERDSHQIFVEPEGLNTHEVYPNGISTSLPYEAQISFVQSIIGFEKAKITRPGYAIEYDFFDPTGLGANLETKTIKNLFFAGQINGTTGYEEAAAQGLLAGINAAQQIKNKAEWHPRRDESYIGVMVDDLITKGVSEPYRMFTSRAEYRLLLREDNADERLTQIAKEMGLIDERRWQVFQQKYQKTKAEKKRLSTIWLQAGDKLGAKLIGSELTHEYCLSDLLKRPDINYQDFATLPQAQPLVTDKSVIEQVQNQIKYAGYIKRQQEEIKKYRQHENTTLPLNFDYSCIKSLSAEVIEKLNKIQPQTLAKASQIEGITPASLSILLVFIKSSIV